MDPSYGIALPFLAVGATAFHQTSSHFVVFFNIEEFFILFLLSSVSLFLPSFFHCFKAESGL